MKIKQFIPVSEQIAKIGRHNWAVTRLIQLSKDFPILYIPLDHLNVYCLYNELSLRDMVSHMQAALSSDLNFPIILDEDGDILDGRHRIMKALLENKQTIKAVRFDENPTPCFTTE